MSVTGEDIYLTSVRIAGLETPTESDLRSAASRAYYASMHFAGAAIPDEFAPTAADRKSKDSHVAVVDALTLWAASLKIGRTEAQFLARNLPRLKKARKKADYDLNLDFKVSEANDALALSKKIIDSAKYAIRKCTATTNANANANVV